MLLSGRAEATTSPAHGHRGNRYLFAEIARAFVFLTSLAEYALRAQPVSAQYARTRVMGFYGPVRVRASWAHAPERKK